jgi:hypothetical protein
MNYDHLNQLDRMRANGTADVNDLGPEYQSKPKPRPKPDKLRSNIAARARFVVADKFDELDPKHQLPGVDLRHPPW